MARQKRGRGRKAARPARRRAAASRPAKRRTARRTVKPRAAKPRKAVRAVAKPKPKAATAVKAAQATSRRRGAAAPRKPRAARKVPRLDRERRTLDDVVQTPPSSLNMDRRGSAVRTGRAELEESRLEHAGMNDVSGGDIDVDVEDAYFTGDEAPGGDNPTPDQDIVDDIGKALGVQYDDNEELKSGDKIAERDKHRWEMDPASSEDYKERK